MGLMKTTWAHFLGPALAALLALPLSGCGTTPPPPGPATEVAIAADPATFSYSNKWRIEVSESARSDGEIVFQVTPRSGVSELVTVPIQSSFGENHVARAIRDAFRDQLDRDRYSVERDDGEDVLVKKRRGEADFALRVMSSTVSAVRIRVQKE
jgi:hypothetical protein